MVYAGGDRREPIPPAVSAVRLGSAHLPPSHCHILIDAVRRAVWRAVLVVEDDPATSLAAADPELGFVVGDRRRRGGPEAGDDLPPRIVVTDLSCRRWTDGAVARAARRGRRYHHGHPRRQGSIETAVTATREGAYDYLATKFIDPADEAVLRRSRAAGDASKSRCCADNSAATALRRSRQHPRCEKLYQLIERAAPTTASVLISGESGTGKELVARAIHQLSLRAGHPWVPVNCAAIPETLLESEISVTSVYRRVDRKEGCFELANRGTLFLEIAEMTPQTQVKRRWCCRSDVPAVGRKWEQTVDVRAIAATNADPVDGPEGETARRFILPAQRVRHGASAARSKRTCRCSSRPSSRNTTRATDAASRRSIRPCASSTTTGGRATCGAAQRHERSFFAQGRFIQPMHLPPPSAMPPPRGP